MSNYFWIWLIGWAAGGVSMAVSLTQTKSSWGAAFIVSALALASYVLIRVIFPELPQ